MAPPLPLRMGALLWAGLPLSWLFQAPQKCLRLIKIYAIGTVKLGRVWLGGTGAVGYLRPMTSPQNPLYAGYRYPAELI
ncbi:MAG: hypothetical protein ABSC06_34525, partial [Rhodopila sp.]